MKKETSNLSENKAMQYEPVLCPVFLSPEDFKNRVRMGDTIINHWASERNPNRQGYFVRFNKYKRKLNGGTYVEMTDKLQNGRRWEVVFDRESKFSIVS